MLMVNNTFILLARSILDSQVFANDKMLKIWVWCLCKANHKKAFVPLKIGKGFTEVEVKRGQFIFGRSKAEDELFYDGSTIYKIMQKFEKLEMISIESNSQFSIITICNYVTYQTPDNYAVTSKEQPSNKQRTSKEQPSNTYKNDNNEKNEKNNIKAIDTKDTEDVVDKPKGYNAAKSEEWFLEMFNKLTGKSHRVLPSKAKDALKARVVTDKYTSNDFIAAIQNCMNDKYHRETNLKYLTPEFITRGDKLELYLAKKPTGQLALVGTVDNPKTTNTMREHLETYGEINEEEFAKEYGYEQ